jgi:NAD(P)-dependent dehydrogenase (short-subunit alcohol dehydrogenase family)
VSHFDFSGRVAVISGASRGIGEAIARAYVIAGANVVIGSRKQENILSAAEALNEISPGAAVGIAAHTGKQEDVQRLVDTAVENFGRLDIAVCNAATNPHFGPLLDAEEWQWDKILEVNVKGYYFLCRAAARQMQKQGSGGKIINISSIAGIKPGLMMGIYSVSKAAVIMLTKVLATELAGDDIQVNAIAPGFVRTKFSQALWGNPALSSAIIDRIPQGRLAEPDEVSGIALYLASDDSDYATGGVFTLDGGFLLT